ncbi:MAG: glycosyltransferase family 2 protein [Bacteroidetes bacterium]|nr:glycosyltransferase family 2 protein [Bacteroidota bacterium]
MNADKKGVSVIVCCYNSVSRLKETLHHLAVQQVDQDLLWELIIVDNNSTDDTAQYAKTIWEQLAPGTSITIVKEPTPGLSYAREKGAATAQYEILIFCDDDNWLDKSYIQTAFQVMHLNSKIGIAGGQSVAACETQKPEWFDRFGQAYAIGHPLLESGIANKRTYLAGAGMIIRKSILEKLKSNGFIPMISDRKANNLISGGDAELCLAVMYMGYDLYYDSRLQFIHFMPAARLQWGYCVKMMTIGHAIPQLFLFLYSYSENSYLQNKEPIFENAIRELRKLIFKKSVKALFFQKPFWLPFKLLLKSQPGSRKEIYLKSNLRKFVYLYVHASELKKAFEKLIVYLSNIHAAQSAEMPININDYTNLNLHEN